MNGVAMISRQLKKICLVMIGVLFLSAGTADLYGAEVPPELKDGASLFKDNCQTCHFVDKKMTGPKLVDAELRVPGGREVIYEWVKNPERFFADNDPYFTALEEEYGSRMTPFTTFSNEDIDLILDYVNWQAAENAASKGGGVGDIPSFEDNETLTSMWGWVQCLIFLIVLILANIAIQIARLRNVEFMAGVDFNKLNGFLMLAFLIVGMIGAVWSTMSYEKYFIMSEANSIHGTEIDKLFWITMAVVLFVFFVTNIILFYFAWKYQDKGDRKATFFPENHKLELIWTVVPGIVLTVLVIFGIKTWHVVMVQDPDMSETYVIELNAQQFAWNIHYPGVDQELGDIKLNLIDPDNLLGVDFAEAGAHDDFMTNEIHLPAGKPVLLKIRSRDVIHSVHMPHFRVKMDAVPGMPTRFFLTAKKTTAEWRADIGDPEFNFELACAEICGKSHFSMRRIVIVETEEEFLKWISEQPTMYKPELHSVKSFDHNNVVKKDLATTESNKLENSSN